MGIVGFYHIPGTQNPADILSKHWGFQQVWPMLKPLLQQGLSDTSESTIPRRTALSEIIRTILHLAEWYLLPFHQDIQIGSES